MIIVTLNDFVDGLVKEGPISNAKLTTYGSSSAAANDMSICVHDDWFVVTGAGSSSVSVFRLESPQTKSD